MDRIDLRVQVEPVGRVDMAKTQLGESSAVIRDRVITARAVAAHRFANMGWSLNSQIPARALRTEFQPERAAMNFLHDELDREHITARGLHKIIRTAWSFADLKGNKLPTMEDVMAAHTLRGKVEA
jgi:magnesium chelatase family protein